MTRCARSKVERTHSFLTCLDKFTEHEQGVKWNVWDKCNSQVRDTDVRKRGGLRLVCTFEQDSCVRSELLQDFLRRRRPPCRPNDEVSPTNALSYLTQFASDHFTDPYGDCYRNGNSSQHEQLEVTERQKTRPVSSTVSSSFGTSEGPPASSAMSVCPTSIIAWDHG